MRSHKQSLLTSTGNPRVAFISIPHLFSPPCLALPVSTSHRLHRHCDMVVARNAELYSPPTLIIEDGVQSSEEGSDLHSPTFEVPVPQDIRYHLGHLHPNGAVQVATSLLIPHFDARYCTTLQEFDGPHPHILETLQLPGTFVQHICPPQPQPQIGYGLQQHLGYDLGMDAHAAALSPVEDYSFNLPQSRHTEPQLRVSYEPPSSSSRSMLPMASDEPSEQPLRTSPSANGSASGSNAATARPPRREASTVVIACRQCRSRKIRCDSTRPVCNNCSRRSNECVYDAVPKRRGPDKRPGTRQRSCKKRPSETEPSGTQAKKRRKIEDDDTDGNLIVFDPKGRATSEGRGSLLSPNSSAADDIAGFHMPQAPPLVLETSIPSHTIVSEVIYPKVEQPLPHRSPPYTYDTLDLTLHRPYPRLVGTNMHRDDETPSIPLSPSTVYERQTWWDTLLNTYERTPQLSFQAIFSDLEFLISTSSYWLFFFNPPALFGSLRDAHQRQCIQPSLILSALAMANLMKSSEIECGVQGRNRAVALRDRAQASLEAACSSHAIDYTLAEAALVLALFESSSHPEHSTQRATESLRFVDRIISALSLSRIDEGDPDVCVFHPDNIPIVFTPGYDLPTTCACVAAPHSPSSEDSPIHSRSHFSYNPPWESSWTPDEHRKEECRRVCWCALNLVSSYTAQCAAFHDEPLDLRLSDPANYAILFPGEAYERMSNHRIPGQSPKHSIWALYCRSMLLWNSCVRYSDTSATWTTDKRASFAIDAWRETRAIEDALDIHQCNLDTSLIYICREYIYNTRMSTTYEFRRLQDIDNVSVPMFTRRNAQEWLYYQDGVARGVQESVKNIGEESGHLLSRRPFQALWFSSQVSMCLALWSYDRGLLQALELAKTFFVPLDALNVLWPCPAQQTRCEDLRLRLMEACDSAGIHPPLNAFVTLPPKLQALTLH